MFDNIGSKIKILAQVCCWVIIVACAITGLVVMFSESFLLGLLIIVAGALTGWTGSFMMYGFGDLVESAAVLRDAEIARQHKASAERNTQPAFHPAASDMENSQKNNNGLHTHQESTLSGPWTCSECGKRNGANMKNCVGCGNAKHK